MNFGRYFRSVSGMLIIVLLILSFGLFSCSTSPSEADARKVLENQLKKEIEAGAIKIHDFKKINAKSGEIFGIKVYAIEYEAKIEFLKDNIGFFAVISGRKGQTKALKDELKFEKTEKGWKGEDGKIY